MLEIRGGDEVRADLARGWKEIRLQAWCLVNSGTQLISTFQIMESYIDFWWCVDEMEQKEVKVDPNFCGRNS